MEIKQTAYTVLIYILADTKVTNAVGIKLVKFISQSDFFELKDTNDHLRCVLEQTTFYKSQDSDRSSSSNLEYLYVITKIIHNTKVLNVKFTFLL